MAGPRTACPSPPMAGKEEHAHPMRLVAPFKLSGSSTSELATVGRLSRSLSTGATERLKFGHRLRPSFKTIRIGFVVHSVVLSILLVALTALAVGVVIVQAVGNQVVQR